MKFQIYQDSAKEWRWRLKAANIIADSGEGYSGERACRDDIDRVRLRKTRRS
jgi:uncharacterized protein YegP (UPF0339 family)